MRHRMILGVLLAACGGTAEPESNSDLPSWEETELLAMAETAPQTPAVNATTVFWLNRLAAEIRTLPKGGGTVSTLATVDSYDWSAQALVADSEHVYVSNNTSVRRIPVSGGEVLELTPGGEYRPEFLAIDGESVYWSSASTMEVRRTAKSGGEAVLLDVATGMIGGIALDETFVYFAAQEGILRVERAGGTRTPLGGAAIQPFLAVDAENVYFVSFDANEQAQAIFVEPKDGGLARPLAVLHSIERPGGGSQYFVDGLVEAGDSVYVSSYYQQPIFPTSTATYTRIAQIAKTDGTLTTMTEGPGRAMGLAVDDSHLYFTVMPDGPDPSIGEVRRIAR